LQASGTTITKHKVNTFAASSGGAPKHKKAQEISADKQQRVSSQLAVATAGEQDNSLEVLTKPPGPATLPTLQHRSLVFAQPDQLADPHLIFWTARSSTMDVASLTTPSPNTRL
jgi:hypothetical protein